MARTRKVVEEAEAAPVPAKKPPVKAKQETRLFNKLTHKANTSVLVNGTTYKIGPDNLCDVPNPVDRAKLLQGEHWEIYDPERRQKAGKIGGITLIGKDGGLVPGQKNLERKKRELEEAADGDEEFEDEEPTPRKPQYPERIVGAPQHAVAPTPVENQQAKPLKSVEQRDQEDADDEVAKSEREFIEENAAVVAYPAVPDIEAGEEWPAPEEAMDMNYLIRMADHYGIKATKKMPKAMVVTKLNEAMFE